MKTIKQLKLAAAVAAGLALVGCGSDDEATSSIPKVFNCTDDSTAGSRVICLGSESDMSDSAVQSELQQALLVAQTGDTYVFPQGKFFFDQTIQFQGKDEDGVDVENIAFKGAGLDKTVIDVSGAASDGFAFESTTGLTFEDFGVYESNNNAIIVKKSNGVIFRRMATVWERDYLATNGAYGLYPVESSNILIEDSFVQGSADAGVYVGQSDSIVVRNNTAVKNVAGIEIENSTNADVYGNIAEGNTGGILVFDLPIGNGKYGSGVRIFDNIVRENNAPNFAAGCTPEQEAADECFEGGVHIVPPGTGIIILSTSDVEIFNNTITDHKTTSIAMTSYMMADARVAEEPNQQATSYAGISKFADKYLDGWSPFVNGINMHDNTITVAEGVADPEGKLIKDLLDGARVLQAAVGQIEGADATKVPDILYDGVGQLMATTPYVDGEGVPNGNSVMATIAGGIDLIAQGLFGAGAEAEEERIDGTEMIPFSGVLYGTDATGVCESNNLDGNGAAVNAASVFPTDYNQAVFAESGTPYSKIEVGVGALQQETPDTATALAMANSFLNDDTMTCATAAFVGTPSSATINGVEYGCGVDDTTSEFCAP